MYATAGQLLEHVCTNPISCGPYKWWGDQSDSDVSVIVEHNMHSSSAGSKEYLTSAFLPIEIVSVMTRGLVSCLLLA